MYNINASDICLGGKIFEALFFIKNKNLFSYINVALFYKSDIIVSMRKKE